MSVQGNVNENNVISHHLDGLNGLQKRPQHLGHKVFGRSSPTVFFLASGVLTQLENFQSRSHAFPLVQAACTYQTLQVLTKFLRL